MRLLFSLLVVVLLFSCDPENKPTITMHSSKLLLTDSISFKTGMITSGRHVGTIFSKSQQDELFYFSNKNTAKKIIFFNDKSELIDEVQLDTVLSRCVTIVLTLYL